MEKITIELDKKELEFLVEIAINVQKQTKQMIANLYGAGSISLETMVESERIVNAIVDKLSKPIIK